MKVLIVDDEFDSRRMIRKFIGDHFEDLVFLNDASSVDEAVTIIKEDKPDILLLDIQLKGSLSFDILDHVKLKEEQIIFITAYDQYALKAFELGASGYILKPIEKEKLLKAVEKAKHYASSLNFETRVLAPSEKPFDKLIIPGAGSSEAIKVSELIFIEADSVYCKLHMKDGAKLITKPLNFIEKKLENHPHFFRPHKSYLVNLNYVKSVGNDGTTLTLDNQQVLPVSRGKKAVLKERLEFAFY
jgi:two-component system LytT family response regulator